jgi:hypothetical protein
MIRDLISFGNLESESTGKLLRASTGEESAIGIVADLLWMLTRIS